jgi:hypothetical protein
VVRPSIVYLTGYVIGLLPRSVSHSPAARQTSDVPTFDVVDAVTPVGTAPCAECRVPIVDVYYEADEGVICAACHTRIASPGTNASDDDRFSRAVAFGIAAAAAGALIYFAVLAATGREVIFVALVVGFLVGKAVRLGARGRGGRRYQWLAVALTYLAIATTYVPFVMKGFSRSSAAATTDITFPMTGTGAFLTVGPPAANVDTPPSSLGASAVDFGALLLLAIAAPVLEGLGHVVTLLVIGCALAQAWRMNRRVEIRITGPYRVRASTP